MMDGGGHSHTIGSTHDTIPDFAHHPTVTSIKDGDWLDAETWGGRVPGADDTVRIDHAVTLAGSAIARNVGVNLGELTVSGAMAAVNILVYHEGELVLQNGADIMIRNVPFDPAIDGAQYGTGLVVFGSWIARGSWVTPFLRLAVEPMAGDSTLTLEEEPQGWKAGDRLVIPDSRQIPVVKQPASTKPKVPLMWQIDECVIESVDGNIVRLTAPLAYDHKGARDPSGALRFLPHAMNIDRRIRVASEDPNGYRGHIMVLERSFMDVEGVEFDGLGRTTVQPLASAKKVTNADGTVTVTPGANQVGRYMFHIHHLMGRPNPTNTGFQGRVVNCAFNHALKWALVKHDSHYIETTYNTFYDFGGSAYQQEQGNESENVVSRNMAVKGGYSIMSEFQPTYGGVDTDFSRFGHEGSPYWISSNNNIVNDNVAANCAFAGFNYNQRQAAQFAHNSPMIPRFRGADVRKPEEWINYKKPIQGAPAILECKRNEVYASAEGFWASFAGGLGSVEDLRLWHIRQESVYISRNAWSILINPIIINDIALSRQNYIGSIGISSPATSYTSGKILVQGGEVYGCNFGLWLAGDRTDMSQQRWPVTEPTVHEYAGLKMHNIINVLDWNPNEADKKTILRDIKATYPEGGWNISVALEGVNEFSDVMRKSELLCYNFNGENFEFFAKQQAPDYVPPERLYRTKRLFWQNTKAPGMTNAQSAADGGNVFFGKIATCTTTKAGFNGFVCPIDGPPPPDPDPEPTPDLEVPIDIIIEPAPVQNTAPEFTMAEIRFTEGTPAVIQLSSITRDPNGDPLTHDAANVSPQLAELGITVVDLGAEVEVRYDGRMLGLIVERRISPAFTGIVDDGR